MMTVTQEASLLAARTGLRHKACEAWMRSAGIASITDLMRKYPDADRAADLEAYLKRNRQYAKVERARRTPEHARLLERRGRLKRYGLTFEKFEALLKKQRGGCAICRTPKGRREWHIDHDHKTGSVRGILCSNCNTALGLFKDSPSRLGAAIRYLKKSETHAN